MTAVLTRTSKGGIPLWVNLLQAVLILIMTQQVFELFLDHGALNAKGWSTEGDANLNLVYEMGARLGAMVVISIFVMVTQNPRQYVVVLLLNVVREASEGIIDPLYPVDNAPAGPWTDFIIHVVVVAIEVAALVTVLRIARRQDAGQALAH